MAKNVFRITPRVSQVIRAIEDSLQRSLDAALAEVGAPRLLVVFNCGDFKFCDNGGPILTAIVHRIEVMQSLAPDREQFLSDHSYYGMVTMRKHTGPTGLVYYTTESVDLLEIDTTDRDDRRERREHEFTQSLNDIPLSV